jgi:chloramphenicol O-acetyltransferase type A
MTSAPQGHRDFRLLFRVRQKLLTTGTPRYNPPMAKYLDVKNWARRDVFEFFLGFDKPYFNICTQLDVTNLLALLRDRPGVSVSLAYHYFALRAANEIEAFRYRLREGKVIVHDVIHGGTTVLLPNENFTLAYFDYDENFEKFIAEADCAVKEVLSGDGAFRPNPSDDRIHFTALPWVSFTSFSHARNWRREDSIPKIAFGKFIRENGRTLLPFSVEVHHALMDGLHVGRYVTRLEEALAEPEICISAEKMQDQSHETMG